MQPCTQKMYARCTPEILLNLCFNRVLLIGKTVIKKNSFHNFFLENLNQNDSKSVQRDRVHGLLVL